VTATLTLTRHILALAIRQVLQQVLHSALTPIGQLGSGGHGLDFLDEVLANEFGPIAVGAVQIGDGANVGATRAVFSAARLLVHVDVEASISAVAFAATNTETAHAAFFGHGESGRRWDDAGDFALVVQFAMVLETVDDVGDGEPQALTPVVRLAESWARLLFNFDAFGAVFIRGVRMAAALTSAIFLDAIAFGHHRQEVFVGLAAPIRNVRAESAGFERFGEHAPTASDDRSWRHVANLTEFGASGLFAIDR